MAMPNPTGTTRRSRWARGVRGGRARLVASGIAIMSVAVPVVVTLVATTVPAAAHAVLLSSTPADGAELERAPSMVVLSFNEPVTVPPDGVRVYDGQLERVDLPVAASDATAEVLVPLRQDLDAEGYVVVWRVVSADSHPVAGVVRFTIGDAAALDDDTVAELFGGAGSTATGVLGPLARAATTIATLMAFGAMVATGFGVARSVASRFAMRSATVGIVASLAAVGVQAAAVTGRGWRALEPQTVSAVMTSGFGQATTLRVIWLAALLILLRWRAPTAVAVLAAGVAAGSFALDGHQRSVDPTWLLMSADVVHVLAVGVWMGGLVMLVSLLTRSHDGMDRRTVAAVRRFSTVALGTVAVVAVSGGVMGWVLVGHGGGIATPYGWTLVAKVAIVVIVVGIAGWNRWRLLPDLERLVDEPEPPAGAVSPTRAGPDPTVPRQLTVMMRIEVGLLALVLVLSGFLVSTPPPVQSETGGLVVAAVSIDATTDVELVIEPASVGLNTVHLYAFDQLGMPTDAIDDVALEFTYVPEGIGPLRIDPFFAGTGHWITNTDILAFQGTWQVELIFGLDRFTEVRRTVTFEVR